MDNRTFGEWLKERITEVGTNARQLAIATRINPSSISNWISGKRVPSMESCYLLADALTLDVDEVLSRAGHRQPLEGSGNPARQEVHRLVDQLPDESIEAIRVYLRFHLAQSRTAPVARAVRARSEPNRTAIGKPRCKDV